MQKKIQAIWRLMEGQRLRYGTAIASLVIASCFLYLVPLIPQITIDGVLAPGDGEPSTLVARGVALLGGAEFIGNNLWWPALVVGALTICAGIFTYGRARLSAVAAERIARNVRERIYDHLQHLPARYFDTAETGDLLQRSTSDVETVRVFLSTQVVEIGRAMLMLLVPIPLMLMISGWMTLASLVLVPFIVAFSLFYFIRVKEAFKQMDEAEGLMTATIQENLTGIRVVKAFARQDFEEAKFEERNNRHRELDEHLYRLFARFWSISDFGCFIQRALVVATGIVLVIRGELQVGAFFFFLTAVTMFIWPVRMMGRILAELGKAMVALGRIEEILDQPREADPEAPITPDLRGGIEFRGVSFSHTSEPVLDNVSFSVRPGETLAILGPSGSGKSTIVNLLLRLYDPDSGTVLLDEHDLAAMPRKDVRARMAVVMQEPFLYSRSLRENIVIGHPGACEEEMVEATSIAAVHDSIESFEEGYQTVVGERGVTLSGGQRQRVAIARALLQDPAVLILDDALSAVDTATESAILHALRTRHGKQTTVIIAHRLSTLMHADRIIVLNHGRVEQLGTHADLRHADGLYRRLWEIQAAGLEETYAGSGMEA